MTKLLTLALAVGLAGSMNAADLKIGVVDMNKAFGDYYKTKEAATKLEGNVAKVKEELNERWATYKKLMDDAEKLDKSRRDPVLGQEARAKKEAELQGKAQEIKSLERDISEFQQRRQGQLQQEQMQERKGLYDEIMTIVKSKSGAYDIVLDKAAVGGSGVPVLLNLKDGAAQDFTAEVIVELNKNAPADTGAKKDEEKKEATKKAK
jgi:outer membrane protein